jgi:hypothetical protein
MRGELSEVRNGGSLPPAGRSRSDAAFVEEGGEIVSRSEVIEVWPQRAKTFEIHGRCD